MRWSVSLAVALLVVLAGCSLPGRSEQPGPAESVTPAEIPELESEPTVTPPPRPSEIPVPELRADPDGVSEIPIEGITDNASISPRELSLAHQTVLNEQPVRVRERGNWTSTGVEVRDRRIRVNRTTILLPDRTYRHSETRRIHFFDTDTVRSVNQSVFTNGSVWLQRISRGSNVTYTGLEGTTRPNTRLRNTPIVIQQALWVETIDAERTTWNGEPHYRLVGTDPTGGLYAFATDYQVTAIVREDGFVRQLSVNYTESPIGRERVVEFTITIDPIERDRLIPPDWVATAQSETRSGRS